MDLYEEILKALESEERVMLATIISSSGSTPASALSKMLVKQGGIISMGTIGGGCMEGDVLLHANRLYDSGKAEILTFHLNEDDIEHGLMCGGSLDVLIEPLRREHLPLIQELKSLRDEGEDSLLVTFLVSDGIVKHKSLIPMNQPSLEKSNDVLELVNTLQSLGTSTLQNSIPELIDKAHRRNETYRLKLTEGEFILEPVSGSPSLIVFGGGHVSKYVSRAASMVGFRVTIVDDRPKFANPQRFPEAMQTLAVDYLEAFDQLTIKLSTNIIIVTRGHRHDEDILERALQTSAKYIGMIGSQRKVLMSYEHLVERGTSVEDLKRVHAPMGIEIGAVTAEEIAISIVAELIRVRRGEHLPLQHKSQSMFDLLAKLKEKSTVS